MTYDPSGNLPPGQYPQYPGGGYGSPAPYGSPPPTHRAWAIVSIILGFFFGFIGMIAGIVATVYSSKVTRQYQAGDYAGAVRASRAARGWAIAATVLWILGLLLSIILRVH